MGIIWISEYMILESAGGEYVGRVCEVDYGDYTTIEPYDRASDYMPADMVEKVMRELKETQALEGYWVDVTESQEWEDYDPDC